MALGAIGMGDMTKQFGIQNVPGVSEVSAVENSNRKGGNYGRTVGDPKLSEQGQKYYDELKKKFGNYDFVLVSSDQKAYAQANASRFANPTKPVVLIDEEKIERMATDEKYRKQYEGIISGAAAQFSQLKENMPSNVKGYGMKVNDDGSTSFFAVLKKASDAQKTRIEKHTKANREAKKAEEKKKAREAKEEWIKGPHPDWGKTREDDDSDEVTISAGSVEELIRKINDYTFSEKSDMIQTEDEMMLGQHIDFRG